MKYSFTRRSFFPGCRVLLFLAVFLSVLLGAALGEAQEGLDYTPLEELVPKGSRSIVFSDHHVASYMKSSYPELQNQDGSFPIAKLKEVDFMSLFCSGLPVDLSELQLFSNLGGLAIYDSPQVTGVGALKSCKKLDYLSFSSVTRLDIPALVQAVPKNGSISLDRCGELDYAAITGWKKLSSVWLGGRNITDLSYLLDIPALDSLDFSEAPNADFASCQELSTLKTLLIFENDLLLNQELWTLIGNNPKLESLLLGSEYSTTAYAFDEAAFSKMKKLTSLEVIGATIPSLDFLANCPNLETLALEKCALESGDFSKLSGLKKLKELVLCGMGVKEISFVKGMSLYLLWLNSNQITDLTPLSQTKKIQKLSISTNPVEDLSPVKKVKGLKYFQYNGYAEIPSLKGVEIETDSFDWIVERMAWDNLF